MTADSVCNLFDFDVEENGKKNIRVKLKVVSTDLCTLHVFMNSLRYPKGTIVSALWTEVYASETAILRFLSLSHERAEFGINWGSCTPYKTQIKP